VSENAGLLTGAMEFKDWLNERYEVDAAARNKELERIAFNHLAGHDELEIVDLGAGTGSNFRYYCGRVPAKKQKWTLIDQDPKLLEEAEGNIRQIFPSHSSNSELGELTIETSELKIQIQFKTTNIFEEDARIVEGNCHLILSNALFDLASEQQFRSLCQALPLDKSVFLTTMNYQSTDFEPKDPSDQFFILHFHNHMSRQQKFGRSMGTDCVDFMTDVLQGFTQNFHSRVSIWRLNSSNKLLQLGIMDFVQNAMEDMSLNDSRFHEWKKNRMDLLNKSMQTMEVGHVDLLCLPVS